MQDDTRSGGIFGEPKDFDPRSTGEFEVFVNEAERLTKRAPEADLSGFDDSAWKNFVGEVERADAARELGFELNESAPLHGPRLRSERSEGDGEDLFKASDGRERKKMHLRAWFQSRIASGEPAESIIKFSAERSPSTAAILRELLAEGL